MDARLDALYAQYRLNTDLLLNCLDGLDEGAIARRPGGDVNSIAYLVLHAIDARHFLASQLGAPLDNPVTPAVGEKAAIDDIETYPSLEEMRGWWTKIGEHLDETFRGLDAAAIEAGAGPDFPVEDGSVLGEIAFLVHHDAYHIGQIALLRRESGHEAMSYKRRA